MDSPTPSGVQDNAEQLDIAAKKRRLSVDGTGGYDNHRKVDKNHVRSSKRPCTPSDLSSQPPDGDFSAWPPVGHLSSNTISVGQRTSSTVWEGHAGFGAVDVLEPSQTPTTGSQTTLDTATSRVGFNRDMRSHLEADNQPFFSNEEDFWPPEDSHLSGGIVSKGNVDDIETKQMMDLPIMDGMDISDTKESSAFEVDQSPWADGALTTEATTIGTTPQAAVGGIKPKGENDGMNEASFDTCFGMIILDTVQVRHGFMKHSIAAGKKVLVEGYSRLIIIRDPESKSYGGLIAESHFSPLWELITDPNIMLSATLKSTTVLEIVVYGCRTEADKIGGMLLDHNCYLQQPDAFDESMTYFNPQCLARGKDDDSMSTWAQLEEDLDTPTPNLSAIEKSKVAELLDSARGPTLFKDVQVSDMLQTSLKDHQRKALAMMVEKESGALRDPDFPSIWKEDTTNDTGTQRFLNTITGSRVYRKPKVCLGGLIADDMGLGKTLTALALIAGSATTPSNESATRATTLVITPLSTLTGWQDQIERHLKPGALQFIVYHGSQRQKNADLLSRFDVVVTTYETVRAEYSQAFQAGGARSPILAASWTRIILDEAHIIQNRSSKRFQAIHALKARHRWCLTGTPIQNRLEDLGALVEFLRVHPFDSPKAFRQLFLDPISQQQASGWERLRALISCISLRRTKEALKHELSLPIRQEIVCKVSLDAEERTAYDLVKRRFALAIDAGGSRMSAFQLILRLRQICDHGVALLPVDLRQWIQQASRFGPQIPLPAETCLSCGRVLEDDADGYILSEALSCSHQVCLPCRLVAKSNYEDSVVEPACLVCRSHSLCIRNGERVQLQLSGVGVPFPTRPSSKVRELLWNLDHDQHQAAAAGAPAEKSVIFSIWTEMLDLIGIALTARGLMFQRLDGTKSHDQRRDALHRFRADEKCNVLIASIGSAALGLDLTAASRVHIIEPGWNPMLEQQALQRVHRVGQTRPVKQIRYVVDGADSVERYILQRQQWKLALVDASLDGSGGRQDDVNRLLKDMRAGLGIDPAL